MKMKFALIALFAALAAQAATVGKVIVRQQWPWSDTVKVEYLLSGASAAQPVDIELSFYDGETPLSADLHNAAAGDVYGLVSDGVHVITLDATRAFGRRRVKIENFRVTLTPVPSRPDLNEELYRIYDLTATTKPIPYESVTRQKLLNGAYGTYETDYAKIGSGFTTPLADVLVWTGVTNDLAYKTDKLVMRRIKAKNVDWHSGSPENELGRTASAETRHAVVLTNDYFIGVFEVTRAQYAKYYGTPAITELDDVPVTGASYGDHIISQANWVAQDGSISSGEWVNWPTNAYRHTTRNNRMIGVMRSATGVKFDIPTEAQWEFACRAMSTNALYSGKDLTTVAKDAAEPNVDEVAWTKQSGLLAPQKVGLKAPNAWGLYDMLGNVSEWCRNWFNDDFSFYFDYPTRTDVTHADPLVDPVGQSSEPLTRGRAIRGGNFKSDPKGARSASRTYCVHYSSDDSLGFRLVCPVGVDWDRD